MCAYLRLLRTSAAATTAIIMITAAMATYVKVGVALPGCGAELGGTEGEAGWVGGTVGVGVLVTLADGDGVAGAGVATAGETVAGATFRWVSAVDP